VTLIILLVWLFGGGEFHLHEVCRLKPAALRQGEL
jgi:hypothetical protein